LSQIIIIKTGKHLILTFFLKRNNNSIQKQQDVTGLQNITHIFRLFLLLCWHCTYIKHTSAFSHTSMHVPEDMWWLGHQTHNQKVACSTLNCSTFT